ncbi:MAG: hypothetical protein A2Y12_01720 [Planctomycetes bacterium GWF2_42_9]|nr:MAG: hypothetical protein A2Y12_01720 [Planctomycetes bacterium GWF2_42_9]HAL45544.1 hypothetical protein [Phycisphaerales bacterium]
MKLKQKKRKAFTLVELLVVISIIALLLAIMLPALSKARAQARKVICGNSLHQWGVALAAYGMENNGKIPRTVHAQGGTGQQWAWPSLVVVDPAVAPVGYNPGDFSVPLIGKYVAGYDKNTKQPPESVWFCPEASGAYRNMIAKDYVPSGYFHMTYDYFGQVKKWENPNPDQKDLPAMLNRDLADNLSGGRKLLMADHLIKVTWSPQKNSTYVAGAWGYNHGLNGPSYILSLPGAAKSDSSTSKPPAIAGTNNLYADGSVKWKHRSQFDLEMLKRTQFSNPTVPFIRSGTAPGSSGYWLLTTY